MGNAQLVPKADNNNFHITESFLQDFQKHVSLVDHAVTGLARGIDIMTLTCKRSLQQGDVEVSNKTGLLTTDRLEANVLNNINEHVGENKSIMIEAVRNCLNFIAEQFAGYIEVTKDFQTDLVVNKYDRDEWDCVKDFKKLSVESLKAENAFYKTQCDRQKKEIDGLKKKEELYLGKIRQLQIQSRILDIMSVGVQTETEDAVNLFQKVKTNTTQSTEMLRTENSLQDKDQPNCENRIVTENAKDDTKCNEINNTLARKKTSVEKHEAVDLTAKGANLGANSSPVLDSPKQSSVKGSQVKIINNSTQTYEDNNLTDFSKKLKNEISAEKEIHRTCKEQIEEKQSEIDTLKLQIQMMKTMKKVQVQLYSPHSFASSTAELEVMSIVSTKLKYRRIELIISRYNPTARYPDIPLLISRDGTATSRFNFRKPNTIQSAINDFKGIFDTKQIAVVLYYRIKEPELHNEIQTNSSNDEGLGLGGVFRVGHSKSLYSSTLNDTAVDGIVDFILNAGEITQTFDDTPL